MAEQDAPRVRRGVGLLLILVALTLSLLLSLMVGSNMQPLGETWRGLIHPDDSQASVIVWSLRVPRTMLAVVVGVAYGIAGALIQAITRNPLADTGILGVNAGAGFAVTLGVTCFGAAGHTAFMWWAMAGALVTTVLVHLIGSGGRLDASPVTLVLAGVALGAVLGGISSALELMNPTTFERLRLWGIGTVAVVDTDGALAMTPYLAAALLIAAAIAGPLNAVALGDDLATALGANIILTRVLGVVAVTLLAGTATALTGGIGFVGLMVPHVVRWFTGPDQSWVLACSALSAPVLVVLSDVLGRVIVPSGELQVGIVTAILGAPVLIVLVRRRRVSGL
ncbi:MAG: iron chelate uptake ABC transporter family permease subunit [Propionibacteriaceae bacterium]|nr:iron chelate uptake ABC transporter family permease subunit [Propionibacteriaceae bacterium]